MYAAPSDLEIFGAAQEEPRTANAAIRATNTSGVTVSNCILQNTGSMAVNASGGAGLTIAGSVVRHAGNGAVFFYAGDRVTLTPAAPGPTAPGRDPHHPCAS